jgi:alpha-tubulin suppressor-like RCC1 family protein
MRRGPVVSILLACLLAVGWSYATSPPDAANGAVSTNATLYAAGVNTTGQLGTGNLTTQLSPSLVSVGALPAQDFAAVSAGLNHTCALTTTGSAYCWGEGAYGRLGTGTTSNQSSPTPVIMPAGTTFSAISAGRFHTCAIATGGTAYCWGEGDNGRLGTGNITDRTSPTAVNMPAGTAFSAISAGEWHTCAVTTTGDGYCWGNNSQGQLGDASTTQRTEPTRVNMPAGTTLSAISTSSYAHTCAITTTGLAYCWGMGTSGRLGNGMTAQKTSPTLVTMPSETAFAAVSVGYAHSCAISTAGVAYCWGGGNQGQLGDGTTTDRTSPTLVSVSASTRFFTIATGVTHTCAISTDGIPSCWGQGTSGRLGTGDETQRRSPVEVSLPAGTTFAAVATGGNHTVFLTGAPPPPPPNPALTPTFSMPVAASDGFTVNVTNYDPAYTWTPVVNTGTLTAGTFEGTTLPLTVTGLDPDTSATVTVTATRTGYTTGTATVSGTSLLPVYTGPDLPTVDAFGAGRNTEAQLLDAQIYPPIPHAVATVSGVTYAEITVGANHACGLTPTGEAYCWGNNYYGQLGNSDLGYITDTYHPPTLVMAPGGATWSALSAGYRYTCGITADRLGYCWGWNQYSKLGVANDPFLLRVPGAVRNGYRWQAISTSTNTTCGVTTGGAALCWGFERTWNGSAFTGSDTSAPTTVSAAGGLIVGSVRDISVAVAHACAVTTSNRAYCWGDNSYGKLGLGSTTHYNEPRPVSAVTGLAVTSVSSVTTNAGSTCALSTEQVVFCWGYNDYGALGTGDTTQRTTPHPVTTSSGMPQGAIRSVVSSESGMCTVDQTNTVRCWGYSSGGLGDGLAIARTTPTLTVRVPAGVEVASLAMARGALGTMSKGCFLSTDGQAWCWYSGDPGFTSLASIMEPAAPGLASPPAGRQWAQLAAGWLHSCGLDTTRAMWCWGDNEWGQLGTGDTVSSPHPILVTGLGAVATISAFGPTTCAITVAGAPYCWGPNWNGELGTGDTTARLTPTKVSVSALATRTFTSIAPSDSHTCALDTARRAWCWGFNGSGRLGTGDQAARLNPTLVTTAAGPAPEFVEVRTGVAHTCAIDTQQRGWCWGQNGLGQLGISSTVHQSYPTQITVSAFTSVSPGDSHTCGLSTDGTAYCWGYNDYGQLGTGDQVNRSEPTVVAGLQNLVAVSSGYRRACAADQAGNAWCWGLGSRGALGTGDTANRTIPHPVDTSRGLGGRPVSGFVLSDEHSWFLTGATLPSPDDISPSPESSPSEPGSTSAASPGPQPVTSRLTVVGGRARSDVATPRGSLLFDFRGLGDADELAVTVTALDDETLPAGSLAAGPRFRITVRTPFDVVEVCVPVDTTMLQLTGTRRDRLRLVRTGADGRRVDITRPGASDSDPSRLCGTTDRFSDIQAVVLASDRLSGDNRFATARTVARATGFSRVDRVYVTDQADPAAPLAAVMATSRGAPLLLTAGTRLPADTRRALRDRPSAKRVEIVDMGDITAASADWAMTQHPTGSALVFIASRTSLPDAVIAAATAARLDAAVLLVDSQQVTARIREAITALQPERLIVVGGTQAVSPRVFLQLAASSTAAVERIAGADRTDTSLRLARRFPAPGGVVVAGGRSGADALVAAPLAGTLRASLILTRSAGTADDLIGALTRLSPTSVTVVGGDMVIAPTMELGLSSTIG